MAATTNERRLSERIDALERQTRRDQETMRIIVAQRERETKRADGYREILTTLIGALHVTLDGAAVQTDDLAKKCYDEKCAEILKPKQAGER